MPVGFPRLAEIQLRAIENSQQAAVSILVTAVSTGGSEESMGALSLYPVDRPAVFILRLRQAARIAFTLTPGKSPVSVEVGPVRWLYEEPR